ncbi:uncharacterized protein [Haliotis asinina]|uniref:uncharacterized protein n=1 Tax=Haliotis asinina TaxID=109174 RepID=UPI00353259BF
MTGGMKLGDLLEKECVELCQLVSNCAAVGWSDRWKECTFHHLELSTEEEPSHTLYTTGGTGITTSTPTVSTSTITTIPTSTEATTTVSMDGTGTYVGAFFIRRDNNQLTSKSQRRASLECAMLCFSSNCTDFTLTTLKDDSVCRMSGSQAPGRSPKKHFEWIKL